jgi:hypothetical protein
MNGVLKGPGRPIHPSKHNGSLVIRNAARMVGQKGRNVSDSLYLFKLECHQVQEVRISAIRIASVRPTFNTQLDEQICAQLIG